MNINILYEDNHVLVVEKPINVPTQEDNSKDKEVYSFDKNIDAINLLKKLMKENDVILVKASNGMHFSEIVDSIK